MNILEFQKQSQRTMTDLGSLLENSIHMTLGMASEYLSELRPAIREFNEVNIMEELGDIQWFAVNYAKLHNISIEYIDDNIRIDMMESLGILCDIDKKELDYKRDTSSLRLQRVVALTSVIQSTESIAVRYGISMNMARQSVIDKLKVRFPEKFDTDKANDRNLDQELKALKGVYNEH